MTIKRDAEYWGWVFESLPFEIEGTDEALILAGMVMSLVAAGELDPDEYPIMRPRARQIIEAIAAAIDLADDRAEARWN